MLVSFLKRIAVLGVLLAYISSVAFVPHTQALSPEQRKLFGENINYFDVDSCGSTDAPSGSISGDLKSLAQQILDNKNISFDYGTGGPTGTQFKRLSDGQKAQTDDGREVDVEPIILITILHIAQSHKVNLSALTDGSSHTAPTNPHGSGKAVDINILDGSHTTGSDDVANKIIDSAAEVLPSGARFGMGNGPFGTKQISGKTFGSFTDNPTHVHVDVLGVSQADDDKAVQAVAGAQASGSNTGNVFILGDSIARKAQSQYEKVFQDKGYTVNVDGSSSRSINGKGTDGNQLSGMEAIDPDKDKIKQASAIVIALGTNGGSNADNIDRLVGAVKNVNPDAKLYWVDTISVGRLDDYNSSTIEPANKAIDSEATGQKYQVVSWFKAVDPDGDPESPTKAEKDPNGYIENVGGGDDLGVHPTDKGSTALANLVADAVAGNISGSSAQTASCCPSGNSNAPGTTLSGNGPGEQVYNYFIGKGLSATSASAVTGNLQLESANWSAINGWGGGGGNYFGIGQWDRQNRYANLVKFAGSTENAGKLNYQLDFIWYELHHGYESTLKNLQGNSSLKDKTIFWGRNYEGALTNGALQMQDQRIGYAIQWSQKGGGGGTSTSATSDNSSSDCSGNSKSTGSGEYKNPFHDMSNLQQERIDEGVDFAPKSGGTVPVYAIGDGEVTVATNQSTFYRPSDGASTTWITYKLTSGPAAGKYIYVAEFCPVLVHTGDKVTSATHLCDMQPRSIETGWALDATSQAAAAYTVYHGHDGYETAYGVNFNQLLVKLGAPSGTLDRSSDPSGAVLGNLPADWPTWK